MPFKPKSITCGCGEEVTKENVGYSQTAEIFYHVTFNKYGEIEDYDEYDRDNTGDGTFYCKSCGDDLSEEEMKKLNIHL